MDCPPTFLLNYIFDYPSVELIKKVITLIQIPEIVGPEPPYLLTLSRCSHTEIRVVPARFCGPNQGRRSHSSPHSPHTSRGARAWAARRPRLGGHLGRWKERAPPHTWRAVNDGRKGDNDVRRGARAQRGWGGRLPRVVAVQDKVLFARPLAQDELERCPVDTKRGYPAQQWRGRRRCWPTARATRGRGARSGPGGDQHPRAGCSRALRHVLAARAQRWGPGRGVACGARRRRRRCCTRSPTWCWACPRCCSWWASAPTAGRGRYWARRTPR